MKGKSSLDTVEMIMASEEAFGTEIDYDRERLCLATSSNPNHFRDQRAH